MIKISAFDLSMTHCYKTHATGCWSLGSLRCYTWCKDGLKRKQYQSALHSTWRMVDVFLEKKTKCLNKCRKKKQIRHQIMLRDLKFLRYWWSRLTCSVTFCWFALHETFILLSFCVFLEMVNCLNTIILKSFLIIVFTSIIHLVYRTIN